MTALFGMVRSDRLAEAIRENPRVAPDCCDLVSTAGYDNDGVTGPQMVDIGVMLAKAAFRYDPNAVIFFAPGDDYYYYQFGKDEADAVARFLDSVAR